MKVIKEFRSEDNTGKIAIKLSDGSIIESVLLVDQNSRITACLSSQVGCPQGCLFCKTASLGFKRNLTALEIVGQFDLLASVFNTQITNIVYMGMGEPLLNTKNVLESIKIFTNPKTYNIFLRRITISTSGWAKGIPDLLAIMPYPGLAFSLITGNQDLRSILMPGTPDLKTIKDALLEYQRISRKRIILEVICFKGCKPKPR
jgi:23S rRNA (adenine2503-C2)-methyltransferase